MYYSTLKVIARSRISVQLDILKPLLRIQQQLFLSVSLLQNYSAHVPSVVNPSVTNVMKIRMSNISVNNENRCICIRLPLLCGAFEVFQIVLCTLSHAKTFFDASPFEKRGPFGIMRAILSGESPRRPENPRMEDDTWNLLQSCWERNPSDRPPMKRIVAMLSRRADP